VSTEEALKHLRQRIESYDLELFVTAVLIQREVGGNLAALMDHIAENVRDRLLAGREMKTLTAQGRLSGVVVGAIPLVLVVALSMLSPGYYDILFTNQIGYWCVGVAAVSYLFAIIIINRITKVDF
jgi:tight adherence protein B